MSPQDAGKRIASLVTMLGEDIARGKTFALKSGTGNMKSLVDAWLTEQKAELRDAINTDATDIDEVLVAVARSCSLRIALYMAVWELGAAALVYPAHTVSLWKPELSYKTSRGAGGIPVPGVSCYFLPEFFRPPAVGGITTDPDIFLDGIDCRSLHVGIKEGIEQSFGLLSSRTLHAGNGNARGCGRSDVD